MVIYKNSFYWTHFKCLIFILFLYTSVGFAQSEKVEFDSLLARSLGADDYGMKQYIFVILKTGDVKVENKLQRDSLFAGHLSNIGRLAKEGKLAVAGPLGKNDKEYRGIFILNVKTKEEAEQCCQLKD